VIDHRRLQRTLFRMQADAGFARAVLAGEPEALASTGLGAAERALLADVDPAGLSADPGGKRGGQLLGNLASEYEAALAELALAQRGGRADAVDGFLAAPELHAAIRDDASLALAFGAWLVRTAEAAGAAEVRALAALELALAAARRTRVERPAPGPGELVLAPGARLVRSPAGALERAERRKTGATDVPPLDAGDAGHAGDPAAEETVLVLARPSSPHRLPELHVERLAPPADAVLARLERPCAPAERARLARQHGAEPDELEGFLAGWLEEGALVGG